MREHRVTVLSGSLRRYPDPADSADPRTRQLVAALGTLPAAPAPRAHFRAELRSQLVAVAPRLVATGAAEAETEHASKPARRASRVPLGRGIRIATACLALIVTVLSGAVWLSRGALPGDTLYGVKRASEDVQLALAPNRQDKAHDLMSFARIRADEVSQLLSQAGAIGSGPQADASISAHTASLVTSTLGSADDDVRQASTLLGDQAVTQHSAAPLQAMLDWGPGQRAALAAIAERIPSGQLHQRAQQSVNLMTSVWTRATRLAAQAPCTCLSTGRSDTLGPLPCAGACLRTAGGTRPGGGSGTGSGTGSGAGGASGSTRTGGGTGPSGGSGRSTGSHPSASTRPSGSPVPSSSLPVHPTKLPSLPSALPSGGLSLCPTVSLGPIQIGPSGCITIGG